MTETPGITDPDESARLQAAYEEDLRARSKPWRLVGCYEETMRQIATILASGASMRGKLAQIQISVDACNRTIAAHDEKES